MQQIQKIKYEDVFIHQCGFLLLSLVFPPLFITLVYKNIVVLNYFTLALAVLASAASIVASMIIVMRVGKEKSKVKNR